MRSWCRAFASCRLLNVCSAPAGAQALYAGAASALLVSVQLVTVSAWLTADLCRRVWTGAGRHS